MADVVLCASRDNDATIRQLAAAVGALGYSLWQDESPAPDPASFDAVTARIGAAKAVIVIWSEAAAGSDWVRAEANVAAGQKKLIQVSADGRPPPIPFDPAQMISILTWRGEDDHPGWRGVKTALATLCGPPPAPSAPIPVTAPPMAIAPIPSPPPPAPAPAPAQSSKAPLILVLLGLIAIAAAAAYYWFYWRAPGPVPVAAENAIAAPPAGPPQYPSGFIPPPGGEAATPPPGPPADQFDRQAVVQNPAGYAIVRSAPTGLGLTVARVDAGETVSTYAQSGDYWRVRTASGQTGYIDSASLRLREAAAAATAATTPPPRPAPLRPPRSRIVKENSEVMSAFCDNAGRGTPQCRDYRRQGGR
jgi:TIR domain